MLSFANSEKEKKKSRGEDLISRTGHRWIFRKDLILRIWQKFAKIRKIYLVNNFSP